MLRKLASAGVFAMVKTLVVNIQPALPVSGSETDVISLDLLTKRGDRSFVYNIVLEALVVERTCTARRATAFPCRRCLLSQKRCVVCPHSSSDVPCTTIADFDRVHIKDLVISVLLVEMGANQLQEEFPNVSLDVERERGVEPYDVAPPHPLMLTISRLLISQHIGVTTLQERLLILRSRLTENLLG